VSHLKNQLWQPVEQCVRIIFTSLRSFFIQMIVVLYLLGQIPARIDIITGLSLK